MFASPLAEYALIRYVSGVPILEVSTRRKPIRKWEMLMLRLCLQKTGDKKYGDDPKWQKYKATVPVFFPSLKFW